VNDDPIDWVSGTPIEAIFTRERWREALKRADAGDKAPLIALLQSDEPFPRIESGWVADLLERHTIAKQAAPLINALCRSPGQETRLLVADFISRHQLVRPRHRPWTPAYRETPKEGRLNLLEARARSWMKEGKKVEDAVRLALREFQWEQLELQGKDVEEELEQYLADTDVSTKAEAREEALHEMLDSKSTDEEIDALRQRVDGKRGSSTRIKRRRSRLTTL
jgi:hypothetical protein